MNRLDELLPEAWAKRVGLHKLARMTAIARLKVTLADVSPQVLRRLDVPLTIRLDRLRLVLQAALGWTNTHLWEIRAGDVGWGEPDPDNHWGDGPLDA